MKAFRTLLKLAERDLETLRRALADQVAKDANVVQRIHGHEQTLRSEQMLAQRDYESARAYGGYAVAAMAVSTGKNSAKTGVSNVPRPNPETNVRAEATKAATEMSTMPSFSGRYRSGGAKRAQPSIGMRSTSGSCTSEK